MVSMDRRTAAGGAAGGANSASAAYRGSDLKLFVRDVRDRQRKKRPIVVRSWSTIKDVKAVIEASLRIPPGAQRLYFGPLLTSGRELPNHRTLHDAGIYRSGECLLLDIRGANNNNGGGGSDGTATAAAAFSSSSSSSSLYSPTNNPTGTACDVCISSSMVDSTPRTLRSLVQEARRGFALGLKPELVLEGSGGTYFLHDARKNKIAVFKPADEEPYAENNPRGYLRSLPSSSSATAGKKKGGQQHQQHHEPPAALRDGVAPGEACIREVAAYLLDHSGASGVPMTTLAEARHPAFNTNGARLKVAEGGAAIGSHSIATTAAPNSPVVNSRQSHTAKKAGSFQEFVRCECTMDDISPSKIGIDEVHKIAVLDIRTMNADRNPANLLVRRRPDDTLELVPIDHGYCLRSVSDVSWMDWCWLDWPQLKKPMSDKLRKYVLDLDIEADARLLSERLNICQEAVDYFRASSYLLKAGVKAGLTLYDIAVRCCRNDNLAETPSMLEKLVDMASDLASAAVENERWHHTAASRALAEQLTPRHGRRSSMLSRMSSGGSTNSRLSMSKSASSAEFVALTRDSEVSKTSLSEVLAGRDSPAMAQSSASDSSSEAADATDADTADDGAEKEEECECEVWAASIIMDVSVDQLIPQHRSARSGSVVSDDCSSDSGHSSSPKGFWHVRPGSSPLPLDDEDDDGFPSWSPSESPRNSVAFSSDDSSSSGLIEDSPRSKVPTVSFALADASPGPYLAPKALAAAAASAFKEKPAAVDDAAVAAHAPLLYRSESGMSRSKSYSALSGVSGRKSSFASKNNPAAVAPASAALTENNDEASRKYFHKFIDLVIVREMSAATNNSNHAMTWSSHHGL